MLNETAREALLQADLNGIDSVVFYSSAPHNYYGMSAVYIGDTALETAEWPNNKGGVEQSYQRTGLGEILYNEDGTKTVKMSTLTKARAQNDRKNL